MNSSTLPRESEGVDGHHCQGGGHERCNANDCRKLGRRRAGLLLDKLGFEHVMGMIGKDGQLDFVTVMLAGARIIFSRAHGAVPQRGKQPVEIYLQVEKVDRYHDQVKKNGVNITDPLTLQWWGDRTFKVLDPNGYEIWFYTNVGEPKPPQGVKLV